MRRGLQPSPKTDPLGKQLSNTHPPTWQNGDRKIATLSCIPDRPFAPG